MVPRSRLAGCRPSGRTVWSAMLSLGHVRQSLGHYLSPGVFVFEGGTWSCDLPLVSMAKYASTVRPWSSKLARCQALVNYTGSEASKSTEELEYRTSFAANYHGRNLEAHAPV